jgi:polyisoprenoid-binding protein YceI
MHKLSKLVLALGIAAALPALAAPKSYSADAAHTFPRFSYTHLGFSTQLSRFNNTSAEVVLDQEAKTASVDVSIDMKSVDTGSATFDEHIQGANFLDTAKFPSATFKSTTVAFVDAKPARIDGNLTIKGITRPVTLTVTSFQAARHPMLKKDAIGANAFTVIKRSDFGAGAYAPAVGDEVRIDIAIEAIAK